MLPAEVDHVRAQALLALEATRLARRVWRAGMAEQDFDGSWLSVRPRVEAVTRAAMVGAARNGARLVPAQLEQMGAGVTSTAVVVPETFGTATMLGADVGVALESSKIHAKQAITGGATPAQALDAGEKWMDGLVRSVVADVDRAAQQALVTATPRMGWVRVCPTPCCKRCAVLSGRWYPHSSGFARHPRCDCGMRVAPQDMTGTEDVLTPADLFLGGGVKGVTRDEARAVADGADFVTVVNAGNVRRGRSNGMTTTEGTTRHGSFGRANRGRQRLTPAGIYRLGSDRDEHVRLLKANGYLR